MIPKISVHSDLLLRDDMFGIQVLTDEEFGRGLLFGKIAGAAKIVAAKFWRWTFKWRQTMPDLMQRYLRL